MKLRIKGNSIRLRLTISDVQKLKLQNAIIEKLHFGNSFLSYSLVADDTQQQINAVFVNNNITISIPKTEAENWANSNIVGLQNIIKINETDNLFILIEKDFKCLDDTNEDQSDNYDNPLLVNN